MHTCKPTSLNTCIPAYSHTCIQSYRYTCIQTYMHTCIQTYMHACMHACIHAYMHTSIHPCMHTCIHAHMHTNMRTFTVFSLHNSTLIYNICVLFPLLFHLTNYNIFTVFKLYLYSVYLLQVIYFSETAALGSSAHVSTQQHALQRNGKLENEEKKLNINGDAGESDFVENFFR